MRHIRRIRHTWCMLACSPHAGGPVTRIRRFSLIAVLTATAACAGPSALAASPMTISDSVADPDGWLPAPTPRSSPRRAGLPPRANSVKVVVVANFLGHGRRLWWQTVERSSPTAPSFTLPSRTTSARRGLPYTGHRHLLQSAVRAFRGPADAQSPTSSAARQRGQRISPS